MFFNTLSMFALSLITAGANYIPNISTRYIIDSYFVQYSVDEQDNSNGSLLDEDNIVFESYGSYLESSFTYDNRTYSNSYTFFNFESNDDELYITPHSKQYYIDLLTTVAVVRGSNVSYEYHPLLTISIDNNTSGFIYFNVYSYGITNIMLHDFVLTSEISNLEYGFEEEELSLLGYYEDTSFLNSHTSYIYSNYNCSINKCCKLLQYSVSYDDTTYDFADDFTGGFFDIAFSYVPMSSQVFNTLYDGTTVWNDGYGAGYGAGKTAGYSEGVEAANDYTFLSLFGAIADTPIMFLRQMLGFEVFGVNALSIVMSMLTGCIILYLIKRIIL